MVGIVVEDRDTIHTVYAVYRPCPVVTMEGIETSALGSQKAAIGSRKKEIPFVRSDDTVQN
jgi:hypothetical protein